MKRNLLFFSLFVICISACSANEKGLFPRFIKNEGNDIKISKEDKERIGQIDEIEHNQILSISVQKIEVHSRPFSFKQDNVIYISKPGDEIKIKNVLYSKKFGTSCLYVTFPDNKKGFIPMKSNPYKDGNFSFKDEIEVNGIFVKILNLKRTYTFESFTNDPAKLQIQPSFDSEVLSEIFNDVRLDATAITSDYKWLYVTYGNHQGWINTKYLCDGIGGPVLYTPEETICEELLWADYR